MLAAERARADRLGDSFSLLSLGIDDWCTAAAPWSAWPRPCRRRLRLTDEAGWLDGRHIGVILPGTPAWALGPWPTTSAVLPGHAPLPECKVYHYPTDWLGSDPEGAGRWGPPPDRRARRPVAAMDPLFFRRLPLWKRAWTWQCPAWALLVARPCGRSRPGHQMDSPGPVFFAQRRGGLGGKPFVLYKFRSMIVDAEARKRQLLSLNEQDGPAFKVQADPAGDEAWPADPRQQHRRVAAALERAQGRYVAGWLRPLPCDESEGCQGWQRRRLDVTPGLTCIWQVQGRSRVSFAEWVRMDLRYISSRSLWGDVVLLVRTVPALMFRKGW